MKQKIEPVFVEYDKKGKPGKTRLRGRGKNGIITVENYEKERSAYDGNGDGLFFSSGSAEDP